MSKFREDPFVIFTLESSIEKHGLNHLRVRKHGDLIVFESGPKADPVRHIRLRRATRQWYTLEIHTHTGQWQIVPSIRAGARDVFETVVRELPWVLVPIA
ncbi:MAG: hypothetical protein ABUL62_30635 [Myxococcales bacterium]|jgi:hypothetical protein